MTGLWSSNPHISCTRCDTPAPLIAKFCVNCGGRILTVAVLRAAVVSRIVFFVSAWLGLAYIVWAETDTTVLTTPFAALTLQMIGGLLWSLAWKFMVGWILFQWASSKQRSHANWAVFVFFECLAALAVIGELVPKP